MILAQTVYVLFGFGSGLIAVGLMALFIPAVTDVVVMLLLVSLPAETFVVARARSLIAWRGVILICIGVAAGIAIGTRILTASDATFVLTILAAFLITAGVVFLILPEHARVHWPSWTKPPVGIMSGTLAGMFGTGGPPLIVYYQLSGDPKAHFRGNLMAIFLIATLARIPAYGVAGLITVPRLLSAAALLPAALIGAWLGNRIHLEISELRFRRLVSGGLIIIGGLLLLRTLQ
jgi:uncharacterized membrane protein YfcA